APFASRPIITARSAPGGSGCAAAGVASGAAATVALVLAVAVTVPGAMAASVTSIGNEPPRVYVCTPDTVSWPPAPPTAPALTVPSPQSIVAVKPSGWAVGTVSWNAATWPLSGTPATAAKGLAAPTSSSPSATLAARL